ncbi:MAG: amidohydrolase family protein [Acidobacteria bacterium]|nr:amidohydrolase family protein [Acidobacteriota bacterium]
MTKAIDIHVHVQPLGMMKPECRALMRSRPQELETVMELAADPRRFLALMDKEGIERAGVINYVAPMVMGFTEEVNPWAANYARDFRDRLIPFGSVDPTTVKDAAVTMGRILNEWKLPAIKLHPPHQLFYPNAYRSGLKSLEVIYRMAEQARLPVMIHTGTSIFPGARNVYADPIYADDVGVDFPNLPVILAHGGRPLWTEAAAFVVRRHKNFLMDISGIPPHNLLKYFPRLEQLADKVLWGSDWPGPGVPGMGSNLTKFCELPLSAEVKQKILHDNAARLFPR